MADMVLMPQMGVSEESAILAQWLVREGDAVKEGQALFSLETGKSAFECLAEKAGTVLKIFAKEGDEIAVGTPVAALGEAGETVSAPGAGEKKATAQPPENKTETKESVSSESARASLTSGTSSDGVKASPRAKLYAEQSGADLSKAVATGPEGRVIERDVQALTAKDVELSEATSSLSSGTSVSPARCETTATSDAEFVDKPLSKIRKVIAENMHKSLSEMAQLTLNRTFDATGLLAFRTSAKNAKGFGLEGITLNDLVLYAVSRTLPEFPDINAHLMGNTLRNFKHVNLAVAVDTPRGLMVPVLRGAERMSVREISEAVRTKAAQCREGSIPPDELVGGSFTVSNLGAAGIESFTPVINPPQTAILGVDTLSLRPREENGGVVFYKAMGLSLTFDHRAVDGAPAANFLKLLAERLENLSLLLAL